MSYAQHTISTLTGTLWIYATREPRNGTARFTIQRTANPLATTITLTHNADWSAAWKILVPMLGIVDTTAALGIVKTVPVP